MVALGVEDYRQGREDRVQERTLLEALRQEYAENRTKLELRVTIYDTRRRAQLALVELGREALTLPADSASTLWAFALHGGTLDPSDGVINSALGAGRLSLIEDPELPQLIARWPSQVADFQDVDQGYGRFREDQLISYLIDRIDPPPFTGGDDISTSALGDEDYSVVLGTPAFNRRLLWAVRHHDVYRVTSANLLELLDETAARLDAVLER